MGRKSETPAGRQIVEKYFKLFIFTFVGMTFTGYLWIFGYFLLFFIPWCLIKAYFDGKFDNDFPIKYSFPNGMYHYKIVGMIAGGFGRSAVDFMALNKGIDDGGIRLADRMDAYGESPYNIVKAELPHIWRIHWEVVNWLCAKPEGMDCLKEKFEVNPSESDLKSISPESDHALISKGFRQLEMIKKIKKECEDDPSVCNPELFKSGFTEVQSMSVIKMEDGNLFIHNPVHLRQELLDFVKSLGGEVKYIMSGSSFHTLYIKIAMECFPNATFIMSQKCRDKLRYSSIIPTNVLDYTIKEDLRKINEELSFTNLLVFPVDGMAFCQAAYLFDSRSGALFETDTIFNGGNYKCFCETYGGTEEKCFPAKCVSFMQFHWDSPGALPKYHYYAMDPASGFVASNPRKDDRFKMAESLRELFKLDFKQVYSVHWSQADWQVHKGNI